MSFTWKDLYNEGVQRLEKCYIDDASFDAFQLLLFVSGFDRSEYYMNLYNSVSAEMEAKYFNCISLRVKGEPLQYIIGEWDFYEHRFYVGKGVLIPRPETEELVEICIKTVKQNKYKRVLDLCAGSGCIGLSIAAACPDVECVLVELYEDAFCYAEKNCRRLALSNVKLVKWDIFECPDNSFSSFDLIVSNPPYIPANEISSLQEEVLKEPLTALDGGSDGLNYYRAIYRNWVNLLSDVGAVAFECGENQANDIIEIFKRSFICSSMSDSYGKERFVFAIKCGEGS